MQPLNVRRIQRKTGFEARLSFWRSFTATFRLVLPERSELFLQNKVLTSAPQYRYSAVIVVACLTQKISTFLHAWKLLVVNKLMFSRFHVQSIVLHARDRSTSDNAETRTSAVKNENLNTMLQTF